MEARAELPSPVRGTGADGKARPASFTARVAAEPLAVRMLLNALLGRFGRHIGPADAGAVELVLAEILNNVVEHAYGAGPPGEIEVGIEMTPAHLRCRIRDWGRPLPGHRIPQGALPDIAAASGDLPEGGWGWSLIREIAEELDYRREGECNDLRLAIPLAFE